MGATPSQLASGNVPRLKNLPPDNPYRDNGTDSLPQIDLLTFSYDFLPNMEPRQGLEKLPHEGLRKIYININFVSRVNLSLTSKHLAGVADTSNALVVDRTFAPDLDTYHYYMPELCIVSPRPAHGKQTARVDGAIGARATHFLSCKLCTWQEVAVSGERPLLANKRMLAAVHHIRAHVNINGNMFTKGMAWLVRDYLEVAYYAGRDTKGRLRPFDSSLA